MKYIFVFLMVFALFFGCGTAGAANNLVLTSDTSRYDFTGTLQVLEDGAQKLTIEQVISTEYQSKFTDIDTGTPNFGFSDSIYWLKTTLTNNLEKEKDWISRWCVIL